MHSLEAAKPAHFSPGAEVLMENFEMFQKV